ncbi:MAG: hypothetical protein DWQ44_06145 [Bacteroidetes bacterium]|nr:MAG: hypothetical protein DWQ33_13075 [Bacteroidota bacterium]REK03406.1 MAG: hypothetical protein DWQ39_09375 [Bacteroidota bacterium]REK34482.1 MAG: hypothetical protein DWQ44_06145 [Bacteroidota bacterium]REK50400.1 MAG: hypothetical protein DWQ48_03525 [Bacteroidota bacterium]
MRQFYLSIMLIFLVLSEMFAATRDTSRGSWGLQARQAYGFVIAHRPALELLQERHLLGAELSIVKTSSGEKEWHSGFLFPDVGINISYFDLGAPKILGYGIVVYPYVNFPLSDKSDWRTHFRYGMGLGYVEKIFDAEENIKNSAIGSHINGVMHFDFHFEKDLGKRTYFEIGAGITHYSNGSTAIPNLGLNIAHVSAGIMHYFGQKTAIKKETRPAYIEDNEWRIYLAGSEKKIRPPGGQKYQVGVLSVSRMRNLNYKSSLGAGIDLFYDNSLQQRSLREGNPDADETYNFRPGIYGAFQLNVGRIGFNFNTGFYPYTRWKGDGNVYSRIGLRYYMKNLFLCMNLKSHFARADFIEWGAGIRFKKLKNNSSGKKYINEN